MSGLQVIKLTDFIRDVGEDEARSRLSSFSCAGLNNEVESYLTEGAFRHSQKKTSITYLVMGGDAQNCLAYYTLAVKPFSVKFSRLTARQKNEMNNLLDFQRTTSERLMRLSKIVLIIPIDVSR